MKWVIYGRNGQAKQDAGGRNVYAEKLEYSGTWMGESFVEVDIKTAYPIDLEIGDYLEYRGERYTINYDPTVIKKARSGATGEGFTYSGVKFDSCSNELTEVMFHDVVLADNEIHYTSLPNFSVYCKDVDDLADRLQANTDRWCKANGRTADEYWLFYTLKNTAGSDGNARTLTRAADVMASCGTATSDAAYTEYMDGVKATWAGAYGADDDYVDSRADERFDRTVTASSQTVWELLAAVKSQFGLNFIVRGRNVFIGTAGVPTEHLFEYGKGKGLFEVDKTAEADQKVVTKLHAYGSNENLPTRYYATLNAQPYATVTEVVSGSDQLTDGTTSIEYVVNTDLGYSAGLFTSQDATGYSVKVRGGGVTVRATAREAGNAGYTTQIVVRYSALGGGQNTNREAVMSFCQAAVAGAKIYFEWGVSKSAFPTANLDYSENNLPNNMAVNYLMLPGFPDTALSDLCRSEYDETADETKYYIKATKDATSEVLLHTESGRHEISFSSDALNPYLLSGEAAEIGVKEGDIFCNEENDDNGLEKVYPTIEEATDTDAGLEGATGARLDTIKAADVVSDNGVWPQDKEGKIPGFTVTLPALGFDLEEATSEGGGELQLSMKDGFCGGRTFEVTAVTGQTDGTWVLKCKRTQDSDTELYYPYSYAASITGDVSETMTGAYQILAGDHYVLTGLAISDTNYVNMAARRLLRKAIHWLCKNDYTRYVYSPKIDEIYMARQHDVALKDASVKSLHDTLKEGDQLLFKDSDLNLSGAVYIEKLTIKENGTGGIPTYDVTLRNEIQVGALQRIQNTVDSLKTDIKTGSGSYGGVSTTDVDRLLRIYGEQYFVSKLHDDTAAGRITFEAGLDAAAESSFQSGLTVGTEGAYGIDAEGQAVLDGGQQRGYSEATDDSLIGGKGFHFYKDGAGRGHAWTDFLYVRMKAVLAELEIRKISYSGGNMMFSNAGSTLRRVVPIYADDGTTITGWKCYAQADDGTTRTANFWAVGDMALCMTFNIESDEDVSKYYRLADQYLTNQERLLYAGTGSATANRYYWRLVTEVGQAVLEDGRTYDYVVLSNRASETLTVGGQTYSGLAGYDPNAENDAPQSEDVIVQAGSKVDAKNRGNLIQLVTNAVDGEAVPSINCYSGVNDYDLSQFKVIQISPDGIRAVAKYIDLRADSLAGESVPLQVFRGAWSESMTYGKGDTVTYGGGTWIYNSDADSTAGVAPSTETGWLLAAEKGEKGDAVATGRNLLRGAGLESLDEITDSENTRRLRYVSDGVALTEGAEGAGGVVATIGADETGDLYRGLYFEADVTEGGTYTLSGKVKSESTDARMALTLVDSDGQEKNVVAVDVNGADTDYRQVAGTFVVPEGYTLARVAFYVHAAGCLAVSQPKLEAGDEATPFTVNEADLVGKDGANGKDGTNGKDGAAGLTLELTPAAVVWNELDDENNTPEDNWEAQTVEARVVDATGAEQTGWTFAFSAENVAIGSTAAQAVTLSRPTYTLSDGTPVWATSGRVVVTATKGGGTLTGEVQVLINALGTWRMNVKNDTMTAVSEKTVWTDAEGNEVTLDGLGAQLTTMRSAIAQNAEGISAEAARFNEDGTLKNKSGLLVTPEGAGLVTQDADGNVASIGTYEGGKIKLDANEIKLAANVEAHLLRTDTANVVTSVIGGDSAAYIVNGEEQNIRVSTDCEFYLPSDGEFAGMRLLIVAYPSNMTGETSKKKVKITLRGGRALVKHIYGATASNGAVDEGLATIDRTYNGNASGGGLKLVFTNYGCDRIAGGPVVTVNNTSTGLTEYYTPNTLMFENGVMELLGLPVKVDAAGLITVESDAAALEPATGTVGYVNGATSDSGTWEKTGDVTTLTQWAVVNYYGESDVTGEYEAHTQSAD